MRFEPTAVPGCVIVHAPPARDERGGFAKTFHATTFEAAGLRTDWREEFYSFSRRNVVRGVHFQRPPADHAKLVFCLEGEVLDVVLDLRVGSPAYGRPISERLTADDGRGLYIPSGCAHGFLSTSEQSLMLYKVTSVYSPECDTGVLWDSIGFDWPVREPLLSDRDRLHPALVDFESPFRFDETAPFR